jgi:outer membrane protein assembly factor BamB
VSLIHVLRFPLLVLLAVLTACSSAPPAPEPKSYPDLPDDAVRLTRLWKVSVGDGLDDDHVRLAPAVTEQHVAAASRDGVVLLVGRDTGKPVWKKETGLAITAGPAAGYGSVLVGTAKGELVALAQADGSEQWRAPLGAVLMAVPAISADMIVALSADGVVHALARESGKVSWTYNTAVPPLSLHANAAPLIADGRVYVATSSGKLICLDLTTGAGQWEVRAASNNGRSELERMNDIVAGLLRVGDIELYSAGFQSQLTLTDVQAGRRRWQFDASSVNDLAEGLGNVYVSDTGGNVQAVDRASGELVWKQPDFAWRTLTNPVVLSNLLVVGDDEGRVHLLAQSDGAVRGRARIGGTALVTLTVRDDVLYAWDENGRLSAWKLR